jgi:cellulose biosynthesis protein BcsQ
MDRARLERFYEYVLIDNAPGMGLLQSCAIAASDEIFVPTELRQFAIDGIVEMAQTLERQFGAGEKLTRIIPNFYRDTRRQNSFIAALDRLFPGKVTRTAVPVDSVFDELVTDGKVLFLHRLYSKGAAFYLKLVHELFSLKEEQVWNMVMEKRNAFQAEAARERLLQRNARLQEQPA